MTLQLNPKLKKFWKAKYDEEMYKIWCRVLYGGRMSSKCLRYDTLVLMADKSVRQIQDVNIGDYLMGPDGSKRKVVDRVDGVDRLYLVRQQGNHVNYYVTGEHKVVHSDMSTTMAMDTHRFRGIKLCGKKTRCTVTVDKIDRYVGIEVNQDHMFCLEDGTITHNSHDAAGVAVIRADYTQTRFLCLRMYQNRIEDSVYTLLKDKIYSAGLQRRFKIYKDAIEHKENGSLFKFYGCAKNIEEIKSFERADVCWVEEAQSFTKEMYKIIKPTIMRRKNAEMWFVFNPDKYSDFAYQRFIVNTPKGCIKQLINYVDNGFLDETAIRLIELDKEEDYEEYRHVYLGEPNMDDDQAIIKRSWVEAAIGADKKLGIDLGGACTVGYDVADSGIDRNCAITFNGGCAVNLDAWKAGEDELRESALRAFGYVEKGGRLIYDSIGVGAHVGSTLKDEGIEHCYYKFNSGDEVKNPDYEYKHNVTNKKKFENRKAQAWQSVSDRLRNTYNAVTKGVEYELQDLISIDPDLKHLTDLVYELCIPHRTYSKRGMDMVESKKDIKKRLKTNKSPDLADAFVMGACPHLADIEEIGFFDIDW